LVLGVERKIGIFEAKTKLSEICENVSETGAEYVITRRGKEIARIVPPKPAGGDNPYLKMPVDAALEAWDIKHGPAPDDEPDFPDVWLTRRGGKSSPFEKGRKRARD
jgi:prevent-host-death family protein